MGDLVMTGGNRLGGDVFAGGAKNAVLPILSATILNRGESVLQNCPDLSDVKGAIAILRALGAKVWREGSTLIIHTEQILSDTVPEALMQEMRSSVIFLGALLARQKRAVISYPGGCEIGSRPIDLHIKALRQMGVHITEAHGYIYCNGENLRGAEIHLSFPSVGATENIMLAAASARGVTTIHNAAKEPEVVDLQDFMRALGIRVSGAGSGIIEIEGKEEIRENAEHFIIPDRIEAFTYLAAGAITGGDVCVKHVMPEHLASGLAMLKEAGQKVMVNGSEVRLTSAGQILPLYRVRTLPYPGFPTDMQAPLSALLTVADGTSVISENIFENRFKHLNELMRMGADVTVDGRVAVLRGVPKLSGANVLAQDLRGGAALTLAGLAAEGETVITQIHHIERGYEDIVGKLSALGANIKKVVPTYEKGSTGEAREGDSA